MQVTILYTVPKLHVYMSVAIVASHVHYIYYVRIILCMFNYNFINLYSFLDLYILLLLLELLSLFFFFCYNILLSGFFFGSAAAGSL